MTEPIQNDLPEAAMKRPPATPCEICGEPIEQRLNPLTGNWNKINFHDKCKSKRAFQIERLEDERRIKTAHDKRRDETTTYEGQIKIGIPYQFHGASFQDHTAGDKIEIWASERNGLCYLTGKVGVGKTRMLYASLRYFRLEGFEFQKWRMVDLVKRLQRLGNDLEAAEDFIREMKTVPVLLLDDMGTEKLTDFIRQDFYAILAEREEWRRATLITSNLSVAEISKFYDPRIASRISGGLCINLIGKDWRRNAKV